MTIPWETVIAKRAGFARAADARWSRPAPNAGATQTNSAVATPIAIATERNLPDEPILNPLLG
jgi:hypothetical protein